MTKEHVRVLPPPFAPSGRAQLLGLGVARLCASRHDPVGPFAGAIVPDTALVAAESVREGTSCLTCRGLSSACARRSCVGCHGLAPHPGEPTWDDHSQPRMRDVYRGNCGSVSCQRPGLGRPNTKSGGNPVDHQFALAPSTPDCYRRPAQQAAG